MYKLIDYYTGKRITKESYKTIEEAEQAKKDYVWMKIRDKAIFNNLILIELINKKKQMKTTANKMQIETAESLLNKTLGDRRQEIRDKAYTKDIMKYKKQLEALFNKYKEIEKETLKLKALVEKNGKLRLEANLYNSYGNPFPTSVEDITEKLIESKCTRRSNSYETTDVYMPETNKAQKEIDRFILNLKLGTALMTDIDNVIANINSIK